MAHGKHLKRSYLFKVANIYCKSFYFYCNFCEGFVQ